MRLLAICESPPTLDPARANGSTLISAHVLAALPRHVTVDLAYFPDRPAGPDERVRTRCATVTELPLRPSPAAWLAATVSDLPRATWQRSSRSVRDAVARLRGLADVTYLHGFHTFALAEPGAGPLVVNEVDPWSEFWEERAARRRGPARWYDLLQARRARGLERRVAALADAYVVVNAEDAALLAARCGRPVDAIPNGVELPLGDHPDRARTRDLVFLGSLDYEPNLEALDTLCGQILPAVRRRVPGVRLTVAGRRPGPGVGALGGADVDVLGEVPSPSEVFASSRVACYPGRTGRGTKNTVLEALAAGCAVVATPESARGLPAGHPVVVADSPDALADAAADLLVDRARADALGRAGRVYVADLPDWTQVAARYATLFERATGAD